MPRRPFSLFALPFGIVSLATLGLFFLADQSLDSIHIASRFADVWLDSLRNTGLQIGRCLDLGGSECDQIEDRLQRPLAYVRATQEREKVDPDERIVSEGLSQMGGSISVFRFRLHWYETVARIAGLGSQDPRDPQGATLPVWLELAKRARAARSRPELDAAEITVLKREVSETIAQSQAAQAAYLERAEQAVVRIRHILYLLVITCVLVMFLSASWISRRLFVAWERTEHQYRERDRALSTALALRVDELKGAVQTKGILLREVQHRVKNNLQLISSLARLQSRQPENAAAAPALSTLRRRVDSMALIHERLCFSESLAEIDFSRYVSHLANNQLQSIAVQSGQIEVHTDVHATLPLEEAMMCGLIISELLSNALEHAFPGPRRGDIWITVTDEGDAVTLVVRDNGVGMPPGLSVEGAESLGLLIVSDLVAQLDGEFTWSNDSGASCRVRVRKRGLAQLSRASAVVSAVDSLAGEMA